MTHNSDGSSLGLLSRLPVALLTEVYSFLTMRDCQRLGTVATVLYTGPQSVMPRRFRLRRPGWRKEWEYPDEEEMERCRAVAGALTRRAAAGSVEELCIDDPLLVEPLLLAIRTEGRQLRGLACLSLGLSLADLYVSESMSFDRLLEQGPVDEAQGQQQRWRWQEALGRAHELLEEVVASGQLPQLRKLELRGERGRISMPRYVTVGWQTIWSCHHSNHCLMRQCYCRVGTPFPVEQAGAAMAESGRRGVPSAPEPPPRGAVSRAPGGRGRGGVRQAGGLQGADGAVHRIPVQD